MSDSKIDNTILYDVHSYTFPYWVTDIDKDENIYVEYQKSHQTGSLLYRIGTWMKGKFSLGINENTLKFIFSSSKPWNTWKLVISDYGSFGLLRENSIEFYESLDEKFTWRIKGYRIS